MEKIILYNNSNLAKADDLTNLDPEEPGHDQQVKVESGSADSKEFYNDDDEDYLQD